MDRASPTPHRITSPDGTPVAAHRSGRGRPLVLVHGTAATAARWRAVLPLLDEHVEACAVDRRGRGASGDSPGYSRPPRGRGRRRDRRRSSLRRC